MAVAYEAAHKGRRPKIPMFCPEEYTALITRCWHNDPAARPDFQEILKELYALKRGFKQEETRRKSQAGLQAHLSPFSR